MHQVCFPPYSTPPESFMPTNIPTCQLICHWTCNTIMFHTIEIPQYFYRALKAYQTLWTETHTHNLYPKVRGTSNGVQNLIACHADKACLLWTQLLFSRGYPSQSLPPGFLLFGSDARAWDNLIVGGCSTSSNPAPVKTTRKSWSTQPLLFSF